MCPRQQTHLIGLGDVLFVAGGAHFLDAAAVHQIDVTSAEASHLHGHVDGGVAGAENDATVSEGELGQVVGLAQFADVVGGGEQAGCIFVSKPQLFAGGQTEAEEHRIELLMQLAEGQVLSEFLPVADFDAADLQQKIEFLLRVIVHQFVLGDPVFVEAASLFPCLENHHVMTVHGTAVSAGQTGRTGADHGDALAG